jgi:signal transduction histidine kinase
MQPSASIRARLTLTYVVLFVGGTSVLLAMSWWLLGRHLRGTVPAAYADEVLARLGTQYVLAIAGLALVALGVGWAVAGRALAPIRSIATTADKISEERLDARVRHDGPADEMHELASAFNAMLDRVEGAVEGQRQFAANASHELRTPLTAMRAEAEVALDDPHATVEDLREVARAVIETADRTDALIEGLLVLAASSAGTTGDDAVVDLSAVARRAAAAARREADGYGVVVRTDVRPARVRGDEAVLERLVGNLVENAIRHGRGEARLSLRTIGGDAVLSVRNGGDPIPPDALRRLSQPFERLQRRVARGNGLGLSIVRAVAEAHGGTLHLAAPATGGLEAEVRLPALVTAR